MTGFDAIVSGSCDVSIPRTGKADWHIVEPTDRWFEAYQRFVKQVPMVENGELHHWRIDSIAGLLKRLRSRPFSSVDDAVRIAEIVIWEFPLGGPLSPNPLDLVVAVRDCRPGAIQVAHLRPGLVTTHERLLLQEAGVSMLLEDLWSLERLMRTQSA
jgi:hypothetical protein